MTKVSGRGRGQMSDVFFSPPVESTEKSGTTVGLSEADSGEGE